LNFLSIACGTAGEESWLVGKFKKVVLIDMDPNPKIKEYYEKHNINGNYEFINKKFQDVHFQTNFDIIYTSSPSDWCHARGWKVPDHYLIFLKNNLAKNGIFIMRFYGGDNQIAHDGELNESFVDNLKKDFKKGGFKLQGLYHHNKEYYDKLNSSLGLLEHSKGRYNSVMAVFSKFYSPPKTKNSSGAPILFFDYDSFDKYNIYPIQFDPSHGGNGEINVDKAESTIKEMQLQLQSMEKNNE
jgi:hypothetical protein